MNKIIVYNKQLGKIEINDFEKERIVEPSIDGVTLSDMLNARDVNLIAKRLNSEIQTLVDVNHKVCVSIRGLEISDGYMLHGLTGRGLTYYSACEDFLKNAYGTKENEFLKYTGGTQ